MDKQETISKVLEDIQPVEQMKKEEVEKYSWQSLSSLVENILEICFRK